MFLPALQLARDSERGGIDFLKFLGRAFHADPSAALCNRCSRSAMRRRTSVLSRRLRPAAELSTQGPHTAMHFVFDAIFDARQRRRAQADGRDRQHRQKRANEKNSAPRIWRVLAGGPACARVNQARLRHPCHCCAFI